MGVGRGGDLGILVGEEDREGDGPVPHLGVQLPGARGGDGPVGGTGKGSI